ncbi:MULTISPECIES: S9 family peptidase [unclassified Microbacterium]|uniref:S9 family peptidase n=1 Tax=unclassified Microbacterium TaxID=2609290 RepID=UPI000EA8922A|nr:MULTISPECIES: S9 family peptidase [unclassified Microbacterium]MBT2485567.1 S9 family peptidase [Microbacterium sp. ISL-108]RKN68353.1 S9 family peptidase [Microbacterium sp. CGR2]
MTDAPIAERRSTLRSHHGETFDDPYEWLRAKESSDVISHLEAENAHTEAATAHLSALRETLFDEIKGRVQETDLSVPTRRGDWWYYSRTEEGAQYGIHCRAAAAPDDWTPPRLEPGVPVPGEVVLLDANAEAQGHEFFSLGAFDTSDDATKLLWSTDFEGDELYTVHVRDLSSGTTLPDEIPNTGGAFFTPDGSGVLYTTRDDAWRPDTLWLHRLGTPVSDDVRLFHEPDEKFWLGAGITRSRRYLVIGVGSSITSEEYLVDLAGELTAEPRIVWPRREGVEYSLDHAVVDGEDRLLILHNDGALDFELVSVAASDPQGPRETIVAHEQGRRLLGMDAFRDFATVEYRSEGLERVGLLDYSTSSVEEIAFDEPLFSAGVSGNPEWHAPYLRLGYTSFVTPGTVYELDLASGELLLRKQVAVLGGHDSAEYGQRREWATASDGTRVPISLVWRRSFGEPGSEARPVHLYGYGSYEHSIDPGFSVARLSELDRGVIFAVAHVRGGGEMGRQWYEDGKLRNKRNTFTDFVACAEHLVITGVTTPERLVAEGGSAGGLLMGAVANLAPELFAGILAAVPFVDALTTILDPSLPLTVIEWDEWGDPLHDAEVYAYMKSYSPYENVRDGVAYPRILAVTSLNDSRVAYVEPAKWVARLREAGASDVLLKCEMVAGHGGVSGRYNSWKERAFELAWLLDTLGLAES